MDSLARGPIKRAGLAAIGLATLLIAGASGAVPALNEAREQVRRFLSAPIVEPYALEGPPRPASPELGQEPPTRKLPAPETPAPPTRTPATEPLAVAPPALAQEPPRASNPVAKRDPQKAKTAKHVKQAKAHERATLAETTASPDLDAGLVDGYLRDSEAKMASCGRAAMKPGVLTTVQVQFGIEPDGRVTPSPSKVTGDKAGVASCVKAFEDDIRGTTFPQTSAQRTITRTFTFGCPPSCRTAAGISSPDCPSACQ